MLQARDKTSELLSSLLFLILGFGFLSGCQSTDNTPEDRQTAEMAPIEVIKSPNDPRAYHFETLPNGLKLLVISDAACLLYTSPSPRDRQKSRMPSSA